MILRRVISHVKNQEWTAIFLDFVIVVVGVFVGIQLGNWNSARQDRSRAEVYSERLKEELRVEFIYTRSLLDYYSSLHEASEVAYQALTGPTDLGDEEVLVNAFKATQYNWYERRRATFDEIVSSGSLALIPDAALREAAIGMYNTPIFSILAEEGEMSHYRNVFRMTIEPPLHDDLWRNCGDKEYESEGVEGLLTLERDCALESSADELADGVRALRNDPEVLRALRLRNAQLVSRVFDLDFPLRTFGMYSLFGEEAAP